MEVKVTRGYQVTIPKEIREKIGIKVGTILEIELQGDKVILKVKKDRKRYRLNKRLQPEDIEKMIEKGALECLL